MNQPRTPLRRSLAALSAFALAALCVVATPAPAHAAVFNVTTSLDAGAGSLRQAVLDANALAGADTITFQGGLGTIVVSSGTIEITEALTITGPGAANLSISRTGNFDLFTINNPEITDADPDVTIEELDFIGNYPLAVGSGVVAVNAAADVRNLTLTNTVWGGFQTIDEGGAIAVYAASGNFTIGGSTFVENAAGGVGGAVYAGQLGGALTITDSVFEDNASESDGGAVWSGEVNGIQISQSEFDDNDALGSGGALFIDEVTASSLINLTNFTNNGAGTPGTATTEGGAIFVEYVDFDETLTIRQSSILTSSLIEGITDTYGAALFFDSIAGDVILESSTISGSGFYDSALNPAAGAGLSIALCSIETSGVMTIINSTLDENPLLDSYAIHACAVSGELNILYSTLVAPGILFVENSFQASFISSSILDASAFPSVVVTTGDPVDVEWSLSSTPLSASITDGGGNTYNVADPLLGPLQNNGGPTPTRLLLPGSPALDAGNPAVSGQPAFDQRGTGFPRVNGRIDIGAIEMPRTLPATGTSSDGAVGLAAILLLVAGIGLVVQGRRAVARRGSRTTA